jgi:hypothetical protein
MATLTNRTIRSTYDQLIHLEDLQFQDGFGTSSLSGSYELIGDQNITGSLHMSGNIYLAGTASIDYIVASYESSSIIYSSGSTKFGDSLDDTHEFTGSITSTGSFYGMAVSGNFTGSGEGLYDIPSASFAETASYASASVSSTSASVAGKSFNLEITQEDSSGATHYLIFGPNTNGESGLLADNGITYVPSTETLAVTKVIGSLEGSASFAETASFLLGTVESASFAVTASLAISTSVINVTSQSFASSGDGPFTGSFSSSFYSFLSGSMTGSYTGSLTGSLIGTASIADFATTASFALNVPTTASYALAADTASHTSGTASLADTATLANTASLALTGNGSFSGSFSGSYEGDGSNLTGLPAGYTVANSSNNRIITSVDATNGNAETNLTFDGTTLLIAGNINTGQGVTEIYLMNQNVRTSDNVSFNSITETSALKYKENIESLDSADAIFNLRPVTFDWKDTGEKDYGLIAEEVNEHLPELVKKDKLGEVEGIKYSKLTSLLIKVVQDQQSQINKLTKDINWLKSHI